MCRFCEGILLFHIKQFQVFRLAEDLFCACTNERS